MFPAPPINWNNPGFQIQPKLATPTVPNWVWSGYPVGPDYDFEGEIDKAVNAQMRKQQELNATGIQTTIGSNIASGLYQAGQSVAKVVDIPWGWIGLGVGAVALLILIKR